MWRCLNGSYPLINGCKPVVDLELSVVEFEGSTPPHFTQSVNYSHQDKVHIKCMGSVGGKTPTKPKLYLLFSNLRLIES
jgi:hypothetical protein